MLSNGILDIEDTEGEEISLTAEAPQFTEEEKLRIESEKEEGNDDDVKRIDLFASEDGEADPLNKLLMAEDGISTLFMKKGGRVPFRGGGQDASSDDFGGSTAGGTGGDQGETSSDSGFSGGNNTSSSNNNNSGGDNNYSVQDDLEDFATNVGKEAKPGGGFKDDGDNRDTYKDPILNMVDKSKIPGTEEYLKAEKTNYVLMPEKKLKMSKGVRPAAVVPLETKKYYDRLDQYIAENTGLLSAYNIEKTITNAIIDKIPFIGPFIPEQYPSRNINFEKIGKYEVPGSDLGFYDPDEYPEFWGKGPDKKEDNDSIIELLTASTETIEDRDETDIFDLWDRIKSNQAKRAMLVEKDIIQDNEPLPITKESVSSQLLNNGGLANLFRVKTQ